MPSNFRQTSSVSTPERQRSQRMRKVQEITFQSSKLRRNLANHCSDKVVLHGDKLVLDDPTEFWAKVANGIAHTLPSLGLGRNKFRGENLAIRFKPLVLPFGKIVIK